MSTQIKVKILAVKSVTQYLIKEVDTDGAKEFDKLESALEMAYSDSVISCQRQEVDVGSHVCVKASLGSHRRSPKKWMRAIVRNVFMSVGTYLYDVYLLDYGIERVVKRADVREMKPQFTHEFGTPYQALSFHLTDVQINNKVDVDIDGKEMVENLFKANDNLVVAKVKYQTHSNRSGQITLQDGSDLGHILVTKGLAIAEVAHTDQYIPNTDVRKPKTSPFAKFIKKNSTSLQNGCSDHNSVSSRASISSVSSIDLSLNSDAADSVIDEEEFTLNFTTKLNEPKKKESNDKPTNGCIKSRRERLMNLFTQIKLREETKENAGSSHNYSNPENDRNESEIKSHHKKRVEEQIDWPTEPKDNTYHNLEMRPAGVQPPPEVLERIYTMKTQKNF